MIEQNDMRSENQYVSSIEQQQEQSSQVEATGSRIDDSGGAESANLVHSPHHRSCCCISCWQKNINSLL